MQLLYQDALEYINNQKPIFLEKTSEDTYICPFCRHEFGSDESALSFNEETKEYSCPHCKRNANIMELLAASENTSLYSSPDQYSIVFKKACSFYDVEIKYDIEEELLTERSGKNRMSDYILNCHDNVYQTTYFKDRGISDELIERFYLGYDENFTDDSGSQNWSAVILPTSATTYEARNINVETDSTKDKFKYRKHGNTNIFNGSCLFEEKEKPIFVCGGIFDALSVIQSGGQAVAIQSSFSVSVLLKTIEKQVPAVPLILVLPNNLNDKLADELKKRQLSYLNFPEINGKYIDINHRLIEDRDGLRKSVEDAIKAASSLPDPIEAAREEYINTSSGHALFGIVRKIKENADKPRILTGFPSIDKALDGGLYPGLYTLGAVSSLGKTTFLLQIADNLAKQGQDVLFFSLEQSQMDLVCKSISRETYEYCLEHNTPLSYAKSNFGISDGRRWKNYSPDELAVMGTCFKRYQCYADHLFIYEGIGNISVEDIREKVSLHISVTNNPNPIVIIDYLQVLSVPENERRSTDKQFVDYNITSLCRMARDFGITIFCISALNRQSYAERISMGAFKESGNIEYGSDVLIGLQFAGVEDRDFKIEEAKEKIPRDVEFCILKNRNVMPHSKGIRMLYDPRFNYFICKDDLMAKAKNT